MTKFILILTMLFCVNAFAEESAPYADDPNLRRASVDPAETAASVAETSKSSTTNGLIVIRNRAYAIEQKLLEEKGESKEKPVPQSLAEEPIKVERGHIFYGNLAPKPYLQLLDTTPSSPTSSDSLERTAQSADRQGTQ